MLASGKQEEVPDVFVFWSGREQVGSVPERTTWTGSPADALPPALACAPLSVFSRQFQDSFPEWSCTLQGQSDCEPESEIK